MTTTIDYLNTLNSLENITDMGLIYETTPDDYSQKRKELESRYEEFKACCDWIEKYKFHPTEKQFRKYVQVQTYTSYYLKHLVEKWSGKYIAPPLLKAQRPQPRMQEPRTPERRLNPLRKVPTPACPPTTPTPLPASRAAATAA